MSYIRYNVYKSFEGDLEGSVRELLRNVSFGEHPIRLVFFTLSCEDYDSHLERINAIVCAWYGVKTPLVTLVSMRTLDCRIAVEVQSVSKANLGNLQFKSVRGVRYAILQGDRSKMLFTEGVRSVEEGFKAKSVDVFGKLKSLFDAEGFARRDIDRQWNYLEDITGSEYVCGHNRQRYQEFNDARSEFYAGEDWSGGYPAATGIGTQGGGVVVEVDAAIKNGLRSVGIDNSLQVSAHKYSEEVLLGEVEVKTTPKFERARAIVYESVFGDAKAQVYVSGTAAIRGEDSLEDNVEVQTMATLENIEFLISKANLGEYGVELRQIPKIALFRVYLKRDEDYAIVKPILVRKYPTVATLYVKSEVCRKELLIEIEGIAE